MKTLIKNGYVIDPANGICGIRDILIDGKVISKVSENIRSAADVTIDASGRIVMPGLVDMHVHLRQPGREDKETIYSGTKAALKGGVTSLLAMPNTQPPMDSAVNIKLLKGILKKDAQANVFICAAITKGRQGKEVSDISGLQQEGVVAVSDDGSSVDDKEVMAEALKKAGLNKVLVICHSEDKALSSGGMVNLGIISTRMGLRGMADEAEYKRVARDVELAKEYSCPLHLAHISSQESVKIISLAKKKGVRITAEATPHHLSLNEEAVLGYDTNFKMNPPLRSKEDVQALKKGLKEGIIDVIASDHAPHTENEKEIEFERAEFGVIGLETILAVGITELVEPGFLDWPSLVEKLALNPARILGIDKGTLSPGKDADLVIIDKEKEWLVEREGLISKSRNCPFLGRKLKGKVEYTFLGGKIAYKA
ncbi:MAG: dihydroorotase [Candidatus Omnitrophota bacterium]